MKRYAVGMLLATLQELLHAVWYLAACSVWWGARLRAKEVRV